MSKVEKMRKRGDFGSPKESINRGNPALFISPSEKKIRPIKPAAPLTDFIANPSPPPDRDNDAE
jgi:hypothetical protein